MIVQRCKNLVSHIFNKPSNHNLIQIHKSISAFSLYFSTKSIPNPQTSTPLLDFFLHKHKFSPKTATKAATALAHSEKLENFDSVLLFLKKNGFSNTHLDNILNHRFGPQILCSSVEKTLKPKIEVFQNLGFSTSDMADIISHDPWLLKHSAENRILPTLLVLKNILGSIPRVAKLLKASAWFFTLDLETVLLPNIEFLKSCGVEMEQLIQHMYLSPRAFLHLPETLKKYVQRVDQMEFDKQSKLYLYAILAFSRMSEATWQRKSKLLMKLGFSEDEIMGMVRRRPQFIAVSGEKIKDVVQVLFASGKYETSDIVNHPGVFMASVENRLKPRIQVCKILETRKLIEQWPAFSNVYIISDARFTEKFIVPYSDALGDIHLPVNKLLKQGHAGNIAAMQS